MPVRLVHAKHQVVQLGQIFKIAFADVPDKALDARGAAPGASLLIFEMLKMLVWTSAVSKSP